MVRSIVLLHEVSFSGGQGGFTPDACLGNSGAWPSAVQYPGPPPEPTIGVTLENSVCSKHPALAECPSMEWQSIDQVWQWSCAGLGANSGESGAVPSSKVGHHLGAWLMALFGGSNRTHLMGLLRVEGIATPEVKFLDR